MEVETRRKMQIVSSIVQLAWLALVLLGLTLVVLLWAIMRFARSRMRFRRGKIHTPYVDAWALAGKRFSLDGDPSEEDEDEQEEGGQNDDEPS